MWSLPPSPPLLSPRSNLSHAFVSSPDPNCPHAFSPGLLEGTSQRSLIII